MSATESPVKTEIPEWIHTMKFHHLFTQDESGAWLDVAPCGYVRQGSPSLDCGEWDGEAICSCGTPICPRCAQLVFLEDALDD